MTLTGPRPKAPYRLVEHSSQQISLAPRTVRQLLGVDGLRMQVSPGGTTDEWVVTPSSVVGVANLEEAQFLIRPKLGIRNLLLLMDVTPGLERWQSDLFEYEQEPNLLVAMVRIFLRATEIALARGLRHDYQYREERLLALRGRIDTSSMVRRPGPLFLVPCVFDDHTPDIGPNRFLLAATRRALRVPGMSPMDRRRLHRLEQTFEEVSEDTDPLAWVKAWVPNRLDRHYLPAVAVARLLLQNLSFRDAVGGATATTFLVDMNRLVETFITEHLRRLCRGKLEVRKQFSLFLDHERRVDIRPDLVFFTEQRRVFVADIKYKAVSTIEDVSSADLYQLFAYVSRLGLSCGALITCIADPQMTDRRDAITVRGSGVRLEIWPLDLTAEPPKIQSSLQLMADRIVRMSQLEPDVG